MQRHATLPVLPSGSVQVTWVFESRPMMVAAPDSQLTRVAQRVAQAVAEEAAAAGFGQHVLSQGWHLLVLSESDPDASYYVAEQYHNALVINQQLLQSYKRHSSHPEEALMGQLALLMSHHLAQHVVSSSAHLHVRRHSSSILDGPSSRLDSTC